MSDGPQNGVSSAPPATGRVLVVDDSLSVRRAIERMLSPNGLTVLAACGGSEAMERLAGERPDLVICDVMLPEVDGYEVCRFVRRQPELAGVPVLLISGAGSPEVEERAAEVGAAGVLTKPFTAKNLVSRVEGLVAAGRAPGTAAAEDAQLEKVLARLGALRGFRAAYVLDAETGEGRFAAGDPPPSGLAAMVRHAGDVAGALGLGGSHDLLIDGDEGTLVVQRMGRVSLAVCFDDATLLGLARHQVRRLCREAGAQP
jgi:CheY-like chemotaxis protein